MKLQVALGSVTLSVALLGALEIVGVLPAATMAWLTVVFMGALTILMVLSAYADYRIRRGSGPPARNR